MIKVKEKELLAILPANIKETTELSKHAKKVLGTLLHWLRNSQAEETKRIFIDNASLCTIASMSKTTLMSAINELRDHNLISRSAGHKRTAGEKNQASEYFIHWNNLKKPVEKYDFYQAFSEFFGEKSTVDRESTVEQNSSDQYSIDKLSKEKNSIDQKSEDKISIDKISEDQKSEDKIRKDNIENKSLNKNEDMIFEINKNTVEDILEYLTINKRLQEKDDWNECLQLANVIKDEVENLSINNDLKQETFNRLRILFNAKRHKLNQAKEKPVQEKVEDNTTESEEGFNLFMELRPKVQWETSIEKLQLVKEEAVRLASKQRIQSNDKYLIDLYKMIDERITMLQQQEDAPQEENVPQAV